MIKTTKAMLIFCLKSNMKYSRHMGNTQTSQSTFQQIQVTKILTKSYFFNMIILTISICFYIIDERIEANLVLISVFWVNEIKHFFPSCKIPLEDTLIHLLNETIYSHEGRHPPIFTNFASTIVDILKPNYLWRYPQMFFSLLSRFSNTSSK